jgi:hypothetical protein
LSATRKILRPFWDCYSIQPKDKTIDWWRWNRRPVDHPNDRCFSIHHALQEGKIVTKCLSWKEKIIRNRTYLWYYSCHTKSVSLEFTHRKHWEDCSTNE